MCKDTGVRTYVDQASGPTIAGRLSLQELGEHRDIANRQLDSERPEKSKRSVDDRWSVFSCDSPCVDSISDHTRLSGSAGS